MTLERLLYDHTVALYNEESPEKHKEISMLFAIEVLKELEKGSTALIHSTILIRLSDIENKRLELEMQLNTHQ